MKNKIKSISKVVGIFFLALGLSTQYSYATTYPAGGSDTQIQVNQSGNLAGFPNLVWDYTGSKLGIGTSSPQFDVDVAGTSTIIGNSLGDLFIKVLGTGGAGDPSIFFDHFGGLTVSAGGNGNLNLGNGGDQVLTEGGSVLDNGTDHAAFFHGAVYGPVNSLDEGNGNAQFVGTTQFSGPIKDNVGSTGNVGDLLSNTGSGVTLWQSAASLGLVSPWITNGSSLHYTTGKVGIGTSTPASILDVNGTTTIESGRNYVNNLVCYMANGVLGHMSTTTAATTGICSAN